MNRWHVSALLALALAAGACSDDAAPAPVRQLQDYIPGVTLTTAWIFPEEPNTLAVAGVFHDGDAPRPGLGPVMAGCQYDTLEPQLPVGVGFDCVSGAFSRGSALTSIFVWLAETPGYWELTLPTPRGSESNGINLSYRIDFGQAAPLGPVNLRLTGLDTAGNVGAIITHRIQLVALPPANAAPDIRAVLTWTGASDLDLHVVDPFGHDVSVFNPTTTEGGRFSGDASGACTTASTNQETIEWPAGSAPKGDYRIYVAYYDDCGAASSAFGLHLEIAGQPDADPAGEFTGPAASSTLFEAGTFTVK